MFPSYPGFEELSLRVEVEWQGRARSVVARLERWPESGRAVVVCAFEKDENEAWLVSSYRFSPQKMIWKTIVFDAFSRTPVEVWQWKTHRKRKLSALIQRAFSGRDFAIVALMRFPELPDEPRIVARADDTLSWVCRDEPLYCNSFDIAAVYWSLRPRPQLTRERIAAEWHNENSDARFAWRWAGLGENERKAMLCGYGGDFAELERVMRLILVSSAPLWNLSDSWSWLLAVRSAGDRWYSAQFVRRADVEKARLLQWGSMLRSYFVPNWRKDLLHAHSCTGHFHFSSLASASVNEAPSAHQQLEAKLRLRDWLRDKTTPDEMDALLNW